eukprot:scaffold237666_cov33-Tisochrysis_lutea.AAC.1
MARLAKFKQCSLSLEAAVERGFREAGFRAFFGLLASVSDATKSSSAVFRRLVLIVAVRSWSSSASLDSLFSAHECRGTFSCC